MPPKRAKKNASTASDDAIPSFPAPPTIQTTPPEEAHTPEQSTRKQASGITQAQKQALMDNLQLEITERARKLRAQYALQAQELRSRLERRVSRIPPALRKRKIQDLIDEHTEKAEPKPAQPVPVKQSIQQTETEERPRKAVKRTSEHISEDFGAEDKENAEPAQPSQAQSQDLPIAKKRAKTTAATANTKATRTASRANARPLQPSTVLSPRSHNSRTLPRSPVKPSGIATSPEKPLPARPINPARPAAARTASRQQAAKKAAPPPKPERGERSSGVSDSSAGTTIVHKAATGAKGRVAAAAKKTAAFGRAATGGTKKAAGAAAAKKENVAPTTAGGRTLRKRG